MFYWIEHLLTTCLYVFDDILFSDNHENIDTLYENTSCASFPSINAAIKQLKFCKDKKKKKK